MSGVSVRIHGTVDRLSGPVIGPTRACAGSETRPPADRWPRKMNVGMAVKLLRGTTSCGRSVEIL
jgi:hypothetical protein